MKRRLSETLVCRESKSEPRTCLTCSTTENFGDRLSIILPLKTVTREPYS
ncbi:rCG59850 [Rattus norvegicus]|uniref:RCG59850 n=1 Tax=Rattus norvegicus TaxID=10116 RepID=A6HQW6_RAT|nr:rCG59850 [Rattus norvegicus]